ncbi:hypothetical protein EW146_g1271 [Bondarzewia mesenterica]|uniref:Uncharacterized protein n=1 Tax=Bondarzewia mesenterica TaxID=1095465 RepID=A0A4S4MAM8_9AGAM|nr:hypothetical protein EW146_g1271 [Bondarzewia mesenterica]
MPTEPPPPLYEQECPEDEALESSALTNDPQILIIPATDSLRFQQGYLGAQGEHAAIEGELQVKGAQGNRWRKLTMDLCTTETAYARSIELGHARIVLYDSQNERDDGAPLPSSFPFAIPLTPDMPQCIHTPQSALAHVLTATLHPTDEASPPLTKALTVHTRRFISHTHTLGIHPIKRSIDVPTRVEVEVPRTTFTAFEPVPVYVTVPSPRRELVVEAGFRLRNIKAEIFRTIRVRRGDDDAEFDMPMDSESDSDDEHIHGEDPLGISLPPQEKASEPSSSSSHAAPREPAAVYKTVISRSGALCRFHTSLPVRLRFLLHQSSPTSSPSDATRPLPAGEFGPLDSDTECGCITQSTLMHSVAFRIRIHATFRNTSTHTERVSTISIPINFLPPPAPLPEVEEWMETAYHKKHDRPPARTVRGDDPEAAPHYDEGEAGPSYVANGEPPPFEERDAPPSFAEASTSSRLPTFLESEQEIYVPSSEDGSMEPLPAHPQHVIEGEGVLFGFPASAQSTALGGG